MKRRHHRYAIWIDILVWHVITSVSFQRPYSYQCQNWKT